MNFKYRVVRKLYLKYIPHLIPQEAIEFPDK